MKYQIFAASCGFVLALNVSAASGPSPQLQERVKRIAFTLNIASSEYASGVRQGKIINPVEYQEAREFLAHARVLLDNAVKSAGLSEFETSELVSGLARLEEMAGAKEEPREVRGWAEAVNLILSRTFGVNVRPLPEKTPSLAAGKKTYEMRCAICHGAQGDGKGPAAAGVHPKPAAFDGDLLNERTPSEYWQVATLGVDGTAMISWAEDLSEQERWDAVSYLWRLTARPSDLEQGRRVFASLRQQPSGQFEDKAFWAQTSDQEAAQLLSAQEGLTKVDAAALVRYLRLNLPGQNPVLAGAGALGGALKPKESLNQVRLTLTKSLKLFNDGQKNEAADLVFEAYLHYEALEGGLKIHQPELNQRLEPAFASLRTMMLGSAGPSEVVAAAEGMLKDLDLAGRSREEAPSFWMIFVQSLTLMLREGMEALLILVAIVAYLRRSGHGSRVPQVFLGAALAVVASLATAWVMERVFQTTKVDREALEGLTMIAAVAVLLYVSNWLLSKIEAKRWQNFIHGKVAGALSSKNILALAAAAFLAVYREGFETVLFYQALDGLAAPGDRAPLWLGFVTGCIILAAVFVLLERFGYRIPLKPFFAGTSALLFLMAFSFMGQGIAELQDAGWMPSSPVSWLPRIPFLGIYPTLETTAGQFLVLTALGLSVFLASSLNLNKRPRPRAPLPQRDEKVLSKI